MEYWEPVIALGTGLITLAALSVILSKNANTSGVLKAAGSSFAGVLSAATAPVAGASSPQVGLSLSPLGSWNAMVQ